MEDLGNTATPEDLIDDIFNNPDCWYDGFVRDMDLEQDIIDNMTSDDLCQQIKEVAEDKLLDYYTKHLEELKEELKALKKQFNLKTVKQCIWLDLEEDNNAELSK